MSLPISIKAFFRKCISRSFRKGEKAALKIAGCWASSLSEIRIPFAFQTSKQMQKYTQRKYLSTKTCKRRAPSKIGIFMRYDLVRKTSPNRLSNQEYAIGHDPQHF
ncbi:hypothetical protein CDAR_8411 [Caerostris darwini]|uniref:Uncharacterized protein n=1 Tax=Caerostris darwini TaxID=1538125 RepID=A0AAV4WS31_9ARAC|nr:hypothetical protein CDAR_8411 [Caerostris darwini]